MAFITIKKSEHPDNWYHDCIGETFELMRFNNNDEEYWFLKNGRTVIHDDAEKISADKIQTFLPGNSRGSVTTFKSGGSTNPYTWTPPTPVISGYVMVSDGSSKKSTQDLIKEECDEMCALLQSKNRKYGDSALSDGTVFPIPATTAIKARINDKLSRLKAENADEDEDVSQDLIGYFILLRIAKKRENGTV